jgi:RimJ/RimL family protein N-acetyltransferase
VRVACRPLTADDTEPLTAFLGSGMPWDAFLLDALDAGGASGFYGAFDGDALDGVAFLRRGAVSAGARTSRHSAHALAATLGARDPWTSVVGPEEPCREIVSCFRGRQPFRVDRVQQFMSVARGEPLGPGDSGARRATAEDLDALVPIIARYRVEDGLSNPGDDHGAWIRAHTMERIHCGNLFVVEDAGAIVFTGAFNFAGRAGAGLGGIYTVPALRARGIASRATSDLCRIALDAGPVATLHVDPRNVAAIRAYEKAGLKRAGEFRLTFR